MSLYVLSPTFNKHTQNKTAFRFKYTITSAHNTDRASSFVWPFMFTYELCQGVCVCVHGLVCASPLPLTYVYVLDSLHYK